jgi:hypothetical protein
MQHINLVENSPDRYGLSLFSRRLSIFASYYGLYLFSTHDSNSVSVIYYVCHYSLDCIEYVPVFYSGCFYTVKKGSRVSRPQTGCHYQTLPGRE